jgi:nitrous-oxide reductase
MNNRFFMAGALILAGACLFLGCKPKNMNNAVSADAAIKAFVPPGQYDEYYNFVSGGFSGQMAVYGIPSGRLLRVIPVFSVDPEKGYGYSGRNKSPC